MTREEAISVLKKNKPVIDTIECGRELCEACDMAIEALEKQEKYRWHDLRKNPEVLPNPEQPCPICILYYLWKDPDSGEYETDMLFADYDGEEWGHHEYGWHAIEFSRVIAWKYIELFEEDNE